MSTAEVMNTLIAEHISKAVRNLREASLLAGNLGADRLSPAVRTAAYEARDELIKVDCELRWLLAEDDD
jgi:hypothetical protein